MMANNSNTNHHSAANMRIAKNSFYMTVRMIVVLCVTLFSTRIILNALGVEDYGIFNVVAGFVSLFSFLSTSMSNCIQRFYNFEYAKNGIIGANKVFNTSFIIQLILAVIVLALLEIFGPWYIQNKMVLPVDRLNTALALFQFSVISFICVIFQAPFLAAVMAHERMGFYSLVSVLDASLKLAIAYVLSYLGGDHLLMYGLLLVIVSLIILTIYACYARSKFAEIRFSLSKDNQLFKSMLAFSGWNLFGSSSGVMKEQGVNLIMNLFFGPVVNAAKGVAAQVNNGIQSFVSNIIVPVRPQLVQSYSLGNIERVMRLTYSVSKFTTYVLYLISLPLLYEIDYVLRLWLGMNVPEYTAPFIRIVIMTSFITNLNGAISGVVHASGKMKNYQLLGAIVNVLSLPIVYFALRLGGSPQLGMVLVGCVTMVNQIVCMLVLKTIVSYSIRDYIFKVIFPFIWVVCLTCWIPIVVIRLCEPGFLRLCMTTVISVLSVAVAIYVVGLTADERKYAMKIFSKNNS